VHIYESDLRSYESDFVLADNAQVTIDGYLRQLRKFAEVQPEAVTIRAAKDFLAETQRRAPSVAYTAARAIRSYVKWYAQEYHVEDWSTQVPWCKEKGDKPQRTATREDVEKILETCDDSFIGRGDFALLTVFGSTTLRRGELARMRWEDIDFSESVLSIPKTKSRKHREVYLSRDAIRALRRYESVLDDFLLRTGRMIEEHPWVWVSRTGAMLQPDAITKLVSKHSRGAEIDVTPQSFRRGFAMHWLRQGGSQTYLEKQAGWRAGSPMVARYVQAYAQEESLAEARKIMG
jgi:integrase